jgi:hypothetical protein
MLRFRLAAPRAAMISREALGTGYRAVVPEQAAEPFLDADAVVAHGDELGALMLGGWAEQLARAQCLGIDLEVMGGRGGCSGRELLLRVEIEVINGEPTEPQLGRGVGDSGDDNADDNPAPAAPCGAGSRRTSTAGEVDCALLGVKCSILSSRKTSDS